MRIRKGWRIREAFDSRGGEFDICIMSRHLCSCAGTAGFFPGGRTFRRRRGVSSLLAMLFLLLFSALALGFYAAATVNPQIARNEKTASDALLAAESGMQFIRYQLGNIDIPTGTPNDQMFAAVATQLGEILDGTPNMGGATIAVVNNSISIPSPTGYINADSTGNKRFRGIITQSGEFLVATVVGQGPDQTMARTIQMKYYKAPRASALFNYGVASRGKIVTSGSSTITGQGDPTRGSVLSTNMTDAYPVVAGGKEISGDISIVNPNANVSLGSGVKVGGTTNTALIMAEHVHKGVQEPDFPDIDVTEYAKYATNKYVSGSNLTNAWIPAGTNPTFNGNTTITGVLYVKAPNKIKFNGNLTIRGVIVVENDAALDLTNNVLDFSGNVTAYPVETLPSSYGDLRKLTGAFVLAKNYNVAFTGSFGTVNGHIIASKISFTGNAGGIVKGSVINLNDVQMDVGGSSDVIIASTGTSNYPTGVTFGSKYAPLPDTYTELY